MGRRMQPIRDLKTVHDIEITLSKLDTFRGERMFLLWEVGIRLGLRIGDIIQLKVGNLLGKTSYTFIPEKTKRTKRHAQPVTVTIDRQLRKVIDARCGDLDPDEWLFPSRKRTPSGNPAHITRQTAHADLQQIGIMCGLKDRIGCHTMRKTFGYHYYQAQHDPSILQKWFDHSSPAVTLIYIGIAEDNLRRMTDRTPFSDMSGIVL